MDEQQSSLPVWQINRHFGWEGLFDDKLLAAVKHCDALSKSLFENYAGKLDYQLGPAIKAYENIVQLRSKITSFTHLTFDTQTKNAELKKQKSSIDEALSTSDANYLTFFDIELAKLSEEHLEKQMTPEVEFYRPHILKVRKFSPHMLDQSVERALTVREPWSSSDPVVQYFSKELAASVYDFDGEKLPLEPILSKLMNPDATIRRRALKTINNGLQSQYIHHFAALSLNLVAGSYHIENQERGYTTLRSRRNLRNDVPDEVVASLLKAVRGKGVELSKRYYLLKKNILKTSQGLQEFSWADRNAPLSLADKEKVYTWDQAVQMVSEGYRKFSPLMEKLFRKQVDEGRIHASPAEGKVSGAYCTSVDGVMGPFQLLNFMGTANDVATLAHESGHGAHFLLSYPVGVLQHHPPLTLAETASIFGEMIVFQDLLAKCDTDEERLAMLMQKLDSIVNSVVRQCSFDKFEELVHTARQKGFVGDKEFDDMWLQATEEYYGGAGEVFDNYEDTNALWSYVGHFHHVPFYVYSYAFADLVVGALYNAYQKSPNGFEEKFLNVLRAGSTKNFVELFEPFDLHPDRPEFWSTSLEVHLGSLLTRAEELAKKLKLA